MALIKHNIGISIKKARNIKGWTQEELANKIKSTKNYISAIENDRFEPSVRILKLISNKLEMPIAFILLLGLNEDCFRKKHKVKFNLIKSTFESMVGNIFGKN